MIDSSKIDILADGQNDILGAKSEGLECCAECHRFFDPKTGARAEKYGGVYVVRVGGDKVCQPCKDAAGWPDR